MTQKRTEAVKKAQAKYQKDKTLVVTLKLIRSSDADIIQKLDSRTHLPGGKQGYIKQLIRKDIRKED